MKLFQASDITDLLLENILGQVQNLSHLPSLLEETQSAKYILDVINHCRQIKYDCQPLIFKNTVPRNHPHLSLYMELASIPHLSAASQ